MFNLINKYMNSNYPNNEVNNYSHNILGTNIYDDPNDKQDSIYFGCGCFWGAEKCFWKLPGVYTTSVGYAGGEKINPSYNEVCTGTTGHAEVVKVVWNTEEIDISDLLKMFWECHDPTQKNRQGNDAGTQYRSAIFYKKNNNLEKIKNSKIAFQKALSLSNFGNIETEIKKIDEYYFAEKYHQQYLARTGSRQYCSASPTKIKLDVFNGSNYKTNDKIWENFNWDIDKCVLRSSNDPIDIKKL